MWRTAKARAKKRNVVFTIEVSDIVIPERCPVLGIRLTFKVGRGHTRDAPSLDRIDSRLGYMSGNVRVISYRANTLKGNASIDEMILIGDDARRLKGGAVSWEA